MTPTDPRSTAPPDGRLDGPVHGYFGLTYANYEVTPRTLAQSMPVGWQARWVACQRELREAFAHIEQPECYEVRPARESTYADLTDAEMLRLHVEYLAAPGVGEVARYYDERDGREHDGGELVAVPLLVDPVPHYNRGRTYVEPRGAAAEPQPETVVLCGSTRFYDAFQQANYDLTMAGHIVLSVGFYPHAKGRHGHGEGVGHDSAEKVRLDELHLRKIDRADWVLVLDCPVDGRPYVGESTAREIAYAEAHGKPVRYVSAEVDRGTFDGSTVDATGSPHHDALYDGARAPEESDLVGGETDMAAFRDPPQGRPQGAVSPGDPDWVDGFGPVPGAGADRYPGPFNPAPPFNPWPERLAATREQPDGYEGPET